MSTKITLTNLAQLAENENQPLLMTKENVSLFPFLSDYGEFFEDYDTNFTDRFGQYYPTKNLDELGTDDPQVVLTRFRKSCKAYCRSHYDELEKQFEALAVEYNPIENYNRIEDWSDTTAHGHVIDSTHGKETDVNNYGDKVVSKSFAAKEDKENLGALSSSDTMGARNDETTDGFAGYNSDEFGNANHSSTSLGEQRNSHTEEARENKYTSGAHLDTETENAREDRFSHEKLPDKETHSGSDVLTHAANIHGNIGVTTNQQMITDEIKLRRGYCLMDYLFEEIVRTLCNFCEDGYDPFCMNIDYTPAIYVVEKESAKKTEVSLANVNDEGTIIATLSVDGEETPVRDSTNKLQRTYANSGDNTPFLIIDNDSVALSGSFIGTLCPIRLDYKTSYYAQYYLTTANDSSNLGIEQIGDIDPGFYYEFKVMGSKGPAGNYDNYAANALFYKQDDGRIVLRINNLHYLEPHEETTKYRQYYIIPMFTPYQKRRR